MTMRPVRTSSTIAVPSIPLAARSPRKAPTMSNSMAPIASTISGRAGSSAGTSRVSVIGGFRSVRLSMRQNRGGLGRAKRAAVVLHQLRHRSRRHVEHGLRVDAEQNGQGHERPERDYLAVVEVLDRGEARLGERTEYDLAIKP